VFRSPVPLCLRCSLSGVPRDSRLSLPLSIWSRYALPSSFTSLLSPLHWLPVLFLRPPVVNRVGLVEVKGLVLLAAGDQWSCGLTGVRSMCMCVCLCMWVHTHIYLHMVSISISGLLFTPSPDGPGGGQTRRSGRVNVDGPVLLYPGPSGDGSARERSHGSYFYFRATIHTVPRRAGMKESRINVDGPVFLYPGPSGDGSAREHS
jgi:hypothetical protein